MVGTGNVSVMNFLNEVAENYPAAISLAAGRPGKQLFEGIDAESVSRWMATFSRQAPVSNLWQYGRTAGIIHELITRQISRDDGVPTAGDRTIVTTGCQEAITLCLPQLCPEIGDVVLVRNPTYIGITGAAAATAVELRALDNTIVGIDAQIEQAIEQLATESKRARAIYLVPNFDNPTGEVLSLEERKTILTVCARHRLVVLEDNPYGMYRYEGGIIPPMAKLDEVGCVIYLSTYSKTIAPAVRIGAATLPETLFGDRAMRVALFDAIVERKSFVTVNTSPLCQAMVGGLLMERDCSLRDWLRPAVDACRRNRDAMLAQLAECFPADGMSVCWNHPKGGFFLCLDVPLRFDAQAVAECATQEGVIVMPMAFFSLDATQDHRIRLAFSATEPEHIHAGIMALSRFIERRCSFAGASPYAPSVSILGKV